MKVLDTFDSSLTSHSIVFTLLSREVSFSTDSLTLSFWYVATIVAPASERVCDMDHAILLWLAMPKTTAFFPERSIVYIKSLAMLRLLKSRRFYVLKEISARTGRVILGDLFLVSAMLLC